MLQRSIDEPIKIVVNKNDDKITEREENNERCGIFFGGDGGRKKTNK